MLDAAEAKSLSVCNPIDFSQLTVGRVFARGMLAAMKASSRGITVVCADLGAGGAIHEAVYKGEDVVLKKTSPNDLNFDPKAFYIEVCLFMSRLIFIVINWFPLAVDDNDCAITRQSSSVPCSWRVQRRTHYVTSTIWFAFYVVLQILSANLFEHIQIALSMKR